MTLDDWVNFVTSSRTSGLVRDFRFEIDRLLDYKVLHPAPTNWDSRSKEGALMRTVVELIKSEEPTTLGNVLD